MIKEKEFVTRKEFKDETNRIYEAISDLAKNTMSGIKEITNSLQNTKDEGWGFILKTASVIATILTIGFTLFCYITNIKEKNLREIYDLKINYQKDFNNITEKKSEETLREVNKLKNHLQGIYPKRNF